MKNLKILYPVIIALVLFITAQFFIVRQVWLQKDEVFNSRYRTVSKEALNELSLMDPNHGFDKVYYLLEEASASYVSKSKWRVSEKDSINFQKNLRMIFTDVLLKDQVLSEYLSSYFAKLGLEKELKPVIFVNRIELIDFDYRTLIYKPEIDELKRQSAGKHLLVNTYSIERNNYKISFDYYIDITNKEKILLREISIVLLVSLISFAIICVIFIITTRRYLEEKRLSNLKTDFINNMTHELKTPLSTITVAGKTLKLKEVLHDKDKILETANMIGKQSVHLNGLINLILEISMWERSQFEVERKKVEVEPVLRDIGQVFRKGCSEECTFKENYDLKGTISEIDILYFTTMINNLLNNAIKYSGKKPQVSLEATNTDGITIKVSDNGVGISKSDQKHIFDKFYRVGTGNIHKTKGLGLGLYYVKKIAEAHGGTVNVSSKPGKGSVFIVTIP